MEDKIISHFYVPSIDFEFIPAVYQNAALYYYNRYGHNDISDIPTPRSVQQPSIRVIGLILSQIEQIFHTTHG